MCEDIGLLPRLQVRTDKRTLAQPLLHYLTRAGHLASLLHAVGTRLLLRPLNHVDILLRGLSFIPFLVADTGLISEYSVVHGWSLRVWGQAVCSREKESSQIPVLPLLRPVTQFPPL